MIVAFIPEGASSPAAPILAMVVQRIQGSCFWLRVVSVETLERLSVICSIKTGTLTATP